jgi:hypothetical protein
MGYSLFLSLSIWRTHATQAERATRLKEGRVCLCLSITLSLSPAGWWGGGGSPGGLCTQVGRKGGRMVCVHRHMTDEVYIHNKEYHNSHSLLYYTIYLYMVIGQWADV